MPQGLGTPIAPIEAQADTEAPEAEEDTEADTPEQASALAEDRVDAEAARAPIAETRVPGTALGKGTNKPRATTQAYAHHTPTVQLLHLVYIKCIFVKAINRFKRKKER